MEVFQVQRQKLFFDPQGRMALPGPPTEDEIAVILAPNNQNCPLNNIVVEERNEGNIRQLRRMAFAAYQKPNRSCRGMNFGIYAGPGQGKTHVVKAFAQTIDIPFLMIQSDTLTSTWQLFQQLQELFTAAGYPLVPQRNDHEFVLPPCIIFFDEAHGLSKDLRTCALLNAMEYNDGWMACVPPGKDQPTYMIDCGEVCWACATTDVGLLFKESEAFHSRFGTHIKWQSAGKKEIARIVHRNFPDLPLEVCDLVAFYERVPRKAVDFTKNLLLEANYSKSDWTEAALEVARNNGIDEYGMSEQQLAVLKALGQRPIAKQNLVIAAKCRIEEVEKIVLPPLLEEFEERVPLVALTRRGVAITKAGLHELNKRGIPNLGERICAEGIK